jgi:hypothetical protein
VSSVSGSLDISDPDDPSAAAIRGLIDQDGGPLVPDAIGEVLRNEDWLYATASIGSLEIELNRVSSANKGPTVTVHVTRSLGFGATVRMVDSSHAAMLLPVGTIARLRVMHRLLLSNWNRPGHPPRVIASVMDRPVNRPVPSGLVPLLSDAQEEADWWTALKALDDATSMDAVFEPDVRELNHLSLSLLMGHEFAHVLRHHPDVRQKVRAGTLLFEVGDDKEKHRGTDTELRRSMENDADMIAAFLVVAGMVRHVREGGGHLPRAFVRLAYATTALIGLFEPRRLSIMEYGDGSEYPHPFLRYCAYNDDFGDCARQVGVWDAYDGNGDFGALKCQEALSWIERDIMVEQRFGGPINGDPTIHVLRHSSAFLFRLAEMQERERALALRLETLITNEYGEFQLSVQ